MNTDKHQEELVQEIERLKSVLDAVDTSLERCEREIPLKDQDKRNILRREARIEKCLDALRENILLKKQIENLQTVANSLQKELDTYREKQNRIRLMTQLLIEQFKNNID